MICAVTKSIHSNVQFLTKHHKYTRHVKYTIQRKKTGMTEW
jgi:hypothetical protein